MRELTLLKKLSMVFGPSGCEDGIAQLLRETLLPYADAVTEDRLGSLIFLYKGTGQSRKNAPVNGRVYERLMLAAHMDEPGFMIQSVDDKGYPHPTKLSVGDGSLLTGRSVTVGNGEKQVSGYMGAMPAHKSGGAAKLDSLYVDIGAKDREEAEKYVCPGDFGVFRTDFEILGSSEPSLKGKALGDRAGCAVLAEVLIRLAEAGFRPAFDTCFCFTRRKKIGTSGITAAAALVEPDVGILLAPADIPALSDGPVSTGKGPILPFIDKEIVYDQPITRFLLALGEQLGIPCQSAAAPLGHRDGGALLRTGKGVRCASVSIPVRYCQGSASVMKQADYLHTIELVLAAVRQL